MPPVFAKVPVKPVEGVTVHALLAIVPPLSVEAQAITTGAPVKAVAGAVITATGAGLVTVIVLVVALVAP